MSGSGKSITSYNFKTSDENDYAFSLNSDYSALHITGSKAISLASGTVYANESDQTIRAGAYSIRAGENTDITIVKNGSSIEIGDIAVDESFYINDTLYTRNDYPINITSNGYYYNAALINGKWNEGATVAVAVTELTNSSNIRDLIQPDNDSILTVGLEKSVAAMVVDDSVNPSYLYADLEPQGNYSYILETVDGVTTNPSWAVNVISLASNADSISINSVLFSQQRQTPTIIKVIVTICIPT